MPQHFIQNPILPGFYPDPSICRVGHDFFLACSSFELYPGIPVFHSRDLAHWTLAGHAGTLKTGLHVQANSFGGGVMAPTIRYHDGTFYIIVCNFDMGGNILFTSTDPFKGWSRAIPLPGVTGIDASLFFDEDGACYVTGTGEVTRPDGTAGRGILLYGFDLETMAPKGQGVPIWDSALRGAASPEAPHLYKKDGWYYLVIAEGGTEHFHAVTVARSRRLFAWFEGNPANPVITHRQFGYTAPLANVGHADLVELEDGSWYAVLLGSRTVQGQYKNLGRESYLCPVVWQRGWPVFSPQSGKVDWTYPAAPSLPWQPPRSLPAARDDFDGDTLAEPWCFWGTPYGNFWRLEGGRLHLACLRRPVLRPMVGMTEQDGTRRTDDCVGVVFRRQTDIDFEVLCAMRFAPQNEEAAGLLVMQRNNNHYRLQCRLRDGRRRLELVLARTEVLTPIYRPGFTAHTTETVLDSLPVAEDTLLLGLRAAGQHYTFVYGPDEAHLDEFPTAGDGRMINLEVDGAMVGTMVGMFATANGQASTNAAGFDWFEYRAYNTGFGEHTADSLR